MKFSTITLFSLGATASTVTANINMNKASSIDKIETNKTGQTFPRYDLDPLLVNAIDKIIWDLQQKSTDKNHPVVEWLFTEPVFSMILGEMKQNTDLFIQVAPEIKKEALNVENAAFEFLKAAREGDIPKKLASTSYKGLEDLLNG